MSSSVKDILVTDVAKNLPNRPVALPTTATLVLQRDPNRAGWLLVNTDPSFTMYWSRYREGQTGTPLPPGMAVSADEGEGVDPTLDIYAWCPNNGSILGVAEFRRK